VLSGGLEVARCLYGHSCGAGRWRTGLCGNGPRCGGIVERRALLRRVVRRIRGHRGRLRGGCLLQAGLLRSESCQEAAEEGPVGSHVVVTASRAGVVAGLCTMNPAVSSQGSSAKVAV